MIRAYLKLHLWLKARCERLTLRQRKIFLYSVSGVYFICCIGLIMPLFVPEKEENETEQTETIMDKIKPNNPELIDTPVQNDSLHQYETFEQATT